MQAELPLYLLNHINDDGDIKYDILKQFVSTTIKETHFKWHWEMLILVGVLAFLGIYIILNEFRKKHFRPHTTGVITGFESHRKSVSILVSYHLENGTVAMGEHNMALFGVVPYVHKKGEEVGISYSVKRSRNVQIISYKLGYIGGLFFLGMAFFGVYLMIFQL